MVGGIVLAAGASRRMGREKGVLEVRGRSFVRAGVEALRGGGCGAVIVVVRAGADEVAREARGLKCGVVESTAGAEQIDSLRLGLRSLGARASAAVALPVDHPLVAAETVAALIARHGSDPDAIVRPAFDGEPGHPTLFPRPVWTALLHGRLPRGARSVVESGAHRVVDVPVADAGVLADIDTAELYRRYTGEEVP